MLDSLMALPTCGQGEYLITAESFGAAESHHNLKCVLPGAVFAFLNTIKDSFA